MADDVEPMGLDLGELFAGVPRAMQPVLGWLGMSEDATLYRGEAALEVDGEWITGSSTAYVRWGPSTRVELKVEPDDVDLWTAHAWFQDLFPNGEVRFSVGDTVGTGRPSRFSPTRSSGEEGPVIHLEIYSFAALGAEESVAAELRFDVVNLERTYGGSITDGRGVSNSRVELVDAVWEVTLDGRPGGDDVPAERPDGEYVISHTGRAMKRDGSAVSIEEARGFASMLQLALSMPQCRWATPIGVEGRTVDGTAAWRLWDLLNVQAWSRPITWLPALYTAECEATFYRCLATRWYESAESERLLRTAAHYYLDAHGHGLLHRGLIMGTALIELVAWEVGTEPGFDDEKLERKIRRLLTECRAPIYLERASGAALADLARSNGWGNGPKALAEMRHTAVHARRYRDGWEWPVQAWLDAAQLCDWYTDLAILALVGYDGRYLNRLVAMNQAEWEWVPWSTATTPA